MSNRKMFRWDHYYRCYNPNEMVLQLPTDDCQITIWTARNYENWYWGYDARMFFNDARRPRLTDVAVGSEREAKHAALAMLIDCLDMSMYKVEIERWCKTDSCGEVDYGYEEVIDILEGVKTRLQEYLACHEEDVIFEMEAE